MSYLLRALGWLFYRSVQIWGWGLRLTPFAVKRLVAVAGGWIWFHLIGFRRRIILLNLSLAFPREKEESGEMFRRRIHALAQKNLENYFLGFFEVIEKTTWTYETMRKKVAVKGVENIRKALDKGRGAFLLTAHIGNWEILLGMARIVGAPLSVIVRYVRNPFWDEVLRLSRVEFDVNLLSETSSGISAMRAYKKGDLVAFVLDQHTGEPHGVLTKFFGIKVWTAKGLAILASRMNAPVLPLYSYRENGKLYLTIEPEIDFSDIGECRSEEQIREHVQRCNDRIETWVRQHPEQYFWIHRRFKAQVDYKTTLPSV